ncbi:MAG: hypothetical protein DCC75_00390 [Proteobacteria bacterium]|nr:MAG: hypothetical protein DCC75_00390 [Pseudomonadota bacterium]
MKPSGRVLALGTLIAVWVVFTVSLTVWWFIFSLTQIERLRDLQHDFGQELIRQQKMLIWEGGAMVLSLLAGGAAISYFMWREIKSNQAVQRFFATFTHELKTPLASLQLQAETLKEQSHELQNQKLLDRLISDTHRLSLHLENSLFVAGPREPELLKEEVVLKDLLEGMVPAWPGISLEIGKNCKLKADRRAMNSIFQNLLHNAAVHGKANKVSVEVREVGAGKLSLIIQDNGRGYEGDLGKLGKLFQRTYSGSGSAIGLYLVYTLCKELGGELRIPGQAQPGFKVELILPGELVGDE